MSSLADHRFYRVRFVRQHERRQPSPRADFALALAFAVVGLFATAVLLISGNSGWILTWT